MCRCCTYNTRNKEEYDEHMETHPKCPECGLFFEDINRLQEHFKNFHSKATCEKCNKQVLESEYEKHKEAHQTMNNFKTGLGMGKVRAKSSISEGPKPKRGLTSFNLFSKHIRPKIRSSNPSATPQDMFKLIAEAWKEADKSHWEGLAKQRNKEDASAEIRDSISAPSPSLFSCPFCDRKYTDSDSFKQYMISSHQAKPSTPGSLNIDPPPNQGRIFKCKECGKLVTSEQDLRRHISSEHTGEILLVEEENVLEGDQPNLEETETTQDTVETQETQETQETSVSNVEIINNDESSSSVENNKSSLNVGEIIFVKKKTIFWPGKIAEINPTEVRIEMFNTKASVSKKIKDLSDIKPFYKDESLAKGRSASWLAAYKAACQEIS